MRLLVLADALVELLGDALEVRLRERAKGGEARRVGLVEGDVALHLLEDRLHRPAHLYPSARASHRSKSEAERRPTSAPSAATTGSAWALVMANAETADASEASSFSACSGGSMAS